jgi:hypothetical protein
MSGGFGQLAIGVTFLAALGTAGIRAVLPTPDGITVHQIAYENGMVTQDRSVTGKDDVFFAFWAANVTDATTGEIVPGCEGDGSFAYPVGRATPTMTLQRWVGSENCVLTPGTYELRGAWSWGDRQTVAKSAPFTVE